MNEMDKLLAQLKTEYETETTSQPNSEASPSPQPKQSQVKSQPSGTFDRILTDLKTELKTEYESDTVKPQGKTTESYRRSPQAEPVTENRFIEELKQENRAREQVAQQLQQQELLAAQKRQQQRERRRQAALQQKAREWLNNLNPKSEEGRWFEEFSYSYDSKLVAAMDYLQAMKESGLQSE